MLDLILYALAFGLIGVLLCACLGIVLLPFYLWVRWRDDMAEIDAKHG
jgi:hypothetical protein